MPKQTTCATALQEYQWVPHDVLMNGPLHRRTQVRAFYKMVVPAVSTLQAQWEGYMQTRQPSTFAVETLVADEE